MDEKEKKLQAEVLESKKEEKNTVKESKIEEKKTENKKQFKVVKENTKTNTIKNKKNTSRKYVVIAIIISLILISVAIFSTIFALINSNNNTILSGIHINGILVEGLTEEQALKIVNDKIQTDKKREIVLNINGEKFSITPEQIEVEYDVQSAIKEAYNIGRNGNIFQNNYDILYSMLEKQNIELEFTYNEQLLINVLEGINVRIPNAMVNYTYCVEEDELIITNGIDGIVIDIENAKTEIIDSIDTGKTEIDIKTYFKASPEINIEKIYSEVKSEPQNAIYKKETKEIIEHKYGMDFDLEEAKQIISEEKEEYVIKLILIEPEILTNEIGEEAFPDLLSSFATKYDETNVSRSNNLKLATSKLNGVVVMPGEVFSYNKTLGKRTAEAGYQYANGFAGGKVVSMLAGGICQISSTLYDAVLYANLNIVERYNHMFQATYVEPGKDATVVYGSLDFKFENTRNYPIMIKAKASGGLAEIKIFGIKEEVEYEIEVITEVLSYTPYKVVYENDSSLAPGQEKVSQSGLQGCKSITYRIVKFGGQEVSREVLSTDTYDPLNKIIKRGPAKAQTPTVETNTTPEKNETVDVPKTEETEKTPVTPEKEEVVDKTEQPNTTEKTENSEKEEQTEIVEKPNNTEETTTSSNGNREEVSVTE